MNLRKNLKFVFLMLFVLHATACHPKVGKTSGAPAVIAEPAIAKGTPVTLTIMGYNYTDRDINDFSVDGTGGGNLSVSSASGGGGGSVCCSSYITGTPAPEIKVRWQADACTYDIWHDEEGKEFNNIFSIYKTAGVKVAAVSLNPKYLEIHIFSDGHVEAAITDEVSAPRLILDQNRRVISPFRKCPNGKKPS